MNGADVAYLEKLFKQHKEDQEKYLDEKFKNLGEKIDGLSEEIEDVEVVCADSISDIEEEVNKTNKKIVVGCVAAVGTTLLLWTAFGTDALAILLKIVFGVPH